MTGDEYVDLSWAASVGDLNAKSMLMGWRMGQAVDGLLHGFQSFAFAAGGSVHKIIFIDSLVRQGGMVLLDSEHSRMSMDIESHPLGTDLAGIELRALASMYPKRIECIAARYDPKPERSYDDYRKHDNKAAARSIRTYRGPPPKRHK